MEPVIKVFGMVVILNCVKYSETSDDIFVKNKWSSNPITTIKQMPIVLSNNHLTMAEFLPNLTFNDQREENTSNAKLQANLKQYTLKGKLKNECNISMLGSYEFLVNTNVRLTSMNDLEIITWYSGSLKLRNASLDIAVVDMKNCELIKRRIEFEGNPDGDSHDFQKFDSALVVFHDDTFDVIVPSEFLCGSNMCKMSYDPINKKIENQQVLTMNTKSRSGDDWEIIRISSYTLSKGYVLVMKYKNFLQILSFDSKDKILGERNVNYKTDKIAFSSTNQHFGLCNLYGPKKDQVVCTQLDPKNLNEKFSIKMKLDNSVNNLALYNKKKGGLVLIIMDSTGGIYSVNVDAEGKHIKNDRMVNTNCDETSSFDVYRESDKTCLQYICKNYTDNNSFINNTINIICF